jgi:hypothetical protein
MRMSGTGQPRGFRDVLAAAALPSTIALTLQRRERRDVPNANTKALG